MGGERTTNVPSLLARNMDPQTIGKRFGVKEQI
jgi:hypothetical protein